MTATDLIAGLRRGHPTRADIIDQSGRGLIDTLISLHISQNRQLITDYV